MVFFFFKQKTAYEMRISDWSSDVCSSDLRIVGERETSKVVRIRWIFLYRVHVENRQPGEACGIEFRLGRVSLEGRISTKQRVQGCIGVINAALSDRKSVV